MPVTDPHSAARGSRPHARRRLRLPVLAAVALALLLACAPAPIIEQGGGYEIVFEDTFDGPELGPLWHQPPTVSGPAPTVSGGAMVLTANATGHGEATSTGPRLADEPNYPFAASWQYGYFEARLRFTDDPYAWPLFWMFSMAKSEAWPEEICPHEGGEYTSEWNILEGGLNNQDGSQRASRSVHSVVHRNTRNGSVGPWCGVEDERRFVHHRSPTVNLAEWHTWGGMWTEDEVCLYLDDAEVGCMETYDTTAQPMHLILSIKYHGLCGNCPPRPAQLQMEVDWVRVWQKT